MIILAKGGNAALPAADLTVTVRWAAQPGTPAVDASALLVGATGKVASDDDFVFYNQPEAADGAVRHLGGTGEQRLRVRPGALPAHVERVVLAASVDQGAFGSLSGLELLVDDASGTPVVRYPVEGAAGETVLVLGEIYRRGDQWKVRAIGQGYDTGLAGLATDYGVNVDDEPEQEADLQPSPAMKLPSSAPATPPPPGVPAAAGYPAPPSSPAGHPAPVPPPAAPAPASAAPAPAAPAPASAALAEEGLPPALRQQISLRKQAVGVALQKKGIAGTRAKVALVLDASGSMSALYSRGTVNGVVERMAPVAAQLDSDATLDGWIFADRFARLPALRIPDLPTWIHDHIPTRLPARITAQPPTGTGSRLSLKRRRPKTDLGYGNNEPEVMADIIARCRAEWAGEPMLVLFFSDGGIYHNEKIAALLREASSLPVFWQFVGLGDADYGILENLDTLPGRVVDNAGFFSVDDIDRVSDEELYDRLLSEFPHWLHAARANGILR